MGEIMTWHSRPLQHPPRTRIDTIFAEHQLFQAMPQSSILQPYSKYNVHRSLVIPSMVARDGCRSIDVSLGALSGRSIARGPRANQGVHERCALLDSL